MSIGDENLLTTFSLNIFIIYMLHGKVDDILVIPPELKFLTLILIIWAI